MFATALRSSTRLAFPRAAMAAPSLTLRARAVPTLGAARFYSNDLNKNAHPFTYGPSPSVKYTEEHEWVAYHQDGTAFIGITKYAADSLGEATYAEVLNQETYEKQEAIAFVESVKMASDLYAPVACKVLEANPALEENAKIVTSDPTGEGWFAHIEVENKEELDDLMSLEEYEASVQE